MSDEKEKTVKPKKTREGIPCTPESLKEYEQVWIGIEESIANVLEKGKDV